MTCFYFGNNINGGLAGYHGIMADVCLNARPPPCVALIRVQVEVRLNDREWRTKTFVGLGTPHFRGPWLNTPKGIQIRISLLIKDIFIQMCGIWTHHI